MNPAQRQTLKGNPGSSSIGVKGQTRSKQFWLLSGKRTIKAISVGPDGRESNCVTKVFQVEARRTEPNLTEASDPFMVKVNCADSILNKKLNPSKKNFQSRDIPDFHQKSILLDFDDSVSVRPKCFYCKAEYAESVELKQSRFCSQCSKPIPHSRQAEPDQVYQG